MHGTNGAAVQLPYELWEVVRSQLCSVEITRETEDLQRWKQLNASVLNSVGNWDVWRMQNWKSLAALLTLLAILGTPPLCLLTTHHIYVHPPAEYLESLGFWFLHPGKWCPLLEVNSTFRLTWVKGDCCCMTLSHFLFSLWQSQSDKWNGSSNGELLGAKLQTLVSVIAHSGNIYMTNKKNLWQRNLSCTCLVLSLRSQFYLAFNHIALHLPSSSQSTKIALISLYLITMWDYGFAKLSVKYDISQLHKIYAQNAYSTWNSTINSRTILKAKSLDKMMQKIQTDG